ncbi:MAG: DUF2399 domain-containing protein [Pseudonocardiaceae bacterium]|nr:DUF2399 domain-containing protein [Pseudonocardiaceae bacterium]
MTDFLADQALLPLWRETAAALDRNGLDWRGRLRLPELVPEGRRRLGVLLGHRIGPQRRAVSLAEIADGVHRLTGQDLPAALVTLGCPPAGRREASDARRATRARRRDELDAAVAREFPDAGWVSQWRDAVWTDGLLARTDPSDVADLAATVRAVLDTGRADEAGARSRSEVAAQLLGDAHGLDSSTPLAALVTRALLARDGAGDERAVWERAGLPLDLVSAPMLTWGLPLLGDCGVAAAVGSMTAAGLPLHLSTAALRAEPLAVAPGTTVLVVENPRLVEAAAQRRLPAAVLTTAGNPAAAPTLAIAQLAGAGAALRYHGDFDAAGLAMTARAATAGASPWRMDGADYLTALDAAADDGVALPRDPAPAPATPWDPALAAEFDRRREIVHEERVMDALLAEHARTAVG